MMTELMALDQSAAFDAVSHDLLLEKLQRYKIGPEALKWFKDYLIQRIQYVVLGRAESHMETVDRGVPQGSVVGPLLYAIFTNEMSESVKVRGCQDQIHWDRSTLFGKQCRQCGVVTQYADDSTYSIGSRTHPRNQLMIKRSLTKIGKYLYDNQLVLNPGKTALSEVMIKQKRGCTAGEPPTLLVKNELGQDKQIGNSQYICVLGANLQNNMTWHSHLESRKKALFPQVQKQIGHLKHNSNLIPKSCRKSIVNGLVVSKLNYLLPLWGTAPETYIRKAQILLNSAARWITGLTRRTRIRDLMDAVGWLTIKEQVLF